MKKIAVLVVMAFFAISSFAQEAPARNKKERPSPEVRAEKMTARMKEKLALSDEQATKIKAINLEAAKKKDEMKKQADADRAAKKAKMKTVEQERDAKIQEVLTEEQKAKYAEMKEKMKDKAHKHKGKHKKQKAEENGE